MDIDNVKTIVDTAREGAVAENKIATVEGLPVLVNRDGSQAQILTAALDLADKRATAPARRKGTATHTELLSFIAHVNRFKDADSAVFADVEHARLTAVFDYHKAGEIAAGGQRWGEHRSIYTCPLSAEWKKWTEHEGDTFSQDDFGDFIEANLDDLTSPVGNGEDKDLPMPSEVLTMARNLIVNTRGTFSRTLNVTTGESSLVCKNENDPATTTKIPRAFMLGIPIFEAGVGYRIEVRLRMQLSGRPTFSYQIHRREALLRDAFGEVRDKVMAATQLPLFAGSPE